MSSFTFTVFSVLVWWAIVDKLQRLKPVHTVYCSLHNLAENWSWAGDVNGRERDETETTASRDRDVDNFSPDETETRRWYVSRPRHRDRDHNPVYDAFKFQTIYGTWHILLKKYGRSSSWVSWNKDHTAGLLCFVGVISFTGSDMLKLKKTWILLFLYAIICKIKHHLLTVSEHMWWDTGHIIRWWIAV